MAFVLSDRIKETTTTTGTGTYNLGGAVSGFETFTANLSNGDTTYYCCTDGTDFEVGLGTFTSSGTTLARTTIISSSNSNNAVSWSSGSRDIFCTLPGSKAVFKNGDDDINIADNDKINFGTDSDLFIQHTGTNANIINSTGNFIIADTSGDVKIQGKYGEQSIIANNDGSVELYHDNSKKFETTSSGATVTGTLAATLSTAAQTNITSVGTLTGLTTSGSINLSQTSGTAIKTTGTLSNADLGVIRASASTSSDTHGFTIKYMGSRTGNNNSYSLFMDNQTGTDVEAMTVLQDGKVGINNISPSAPLDVSGDAEITGTLTAGEVSATTLDIGGTNITATAAELNYVDVTTLGTVQASKAVTADANGDVLFPDNENLFFGTGSDLKIFHNGSHSFIREQGTGDLKIQATSLSIEAGSGEEFITATANGAVELYHDDVKKFETTSDGAKISGGTGDAVLLLEADTTNTDENDNARIEYSQDGGGVVASHGTDGNNRFFIQTTTGSGTTNFDMGGGVETNLYYGTNKKFETTSTGATVSGDLLIESTDAGASDNPTLELYRNSSSPAVNDLMGHIIFSGEDAAGNKANYAEIESIITDTTDGSEDGILRLRATINGAMTTYYNAGYGANFFFKNVALHTGVNLSFEGATNNNFETLVTVVDPTQDNTITLPDATGTVLTTGNSDTPTTTTSSSDADFVLVDDGGTMKKITPSNLGITSGGASKGFAVAMAIAL